jgi:ribokinase
MSIVVVGSLSMDFTAQAQHLPRPGETVLGTGFVMVPGGKGNNQATTCARLGADVTLVGCVGTDMFGDQVIQRCAAEGVDVSALSALSGCTTGIAHITVGAGGENAITVIPGANGRLTGDMVRRYASKFAGATVVLAQLEIPLEAVHAALEVGRRAGALTILNPAPAAELPADLLRLVDVITPNETEASTLTGREVRSIDSAREAALMLLERGPGRVVITLGDRGALYTDGQTEQFISPFRVLAVDTVAAGDAFCGALATAIDRGESLAQALTFASAAGAVTVTKPGATSSLPFASEVTDLMAAGNGDAAAAQ